jgi:hypothetical protein
MTIRPLQLDVRDEINKLKAQNVTFIMALTTTQKPELAPQWSAWFPEINVWAFERVGFPYSTSKLAGASLSDFFFPRYSSSLLFLHCNNPHSQLISFAGFLPMLRQRVHDLPELQCFHCRH